MKKVIYIHQYIKGSGYWPPKDMPWDHYTYSWGARLARMFKKYNPDYDVECWRLDSAEKEYGEKRFDDVNFRIYPASGNKHFGIYSLKFIKDLLSIKERVILNVQGVHKPLMYLVLFFRKKNFIVTAYHHGNDYSPYFNLKHSKFIKKILSFFYLLIEKLLIRRVDFFFIIDKNYSPYLKKIYKKLNGKNHILQPVGIDIESFVPLNKADAKKMLGLDENKKYIFYVGKYDHVKEVDKLAIIYQQIKKIDPDIRLITAGGEKGDVYYDDIVNCGAIELGPVMNNELFKYYSAADVYASCTFRYDYFGGVGIAMLEALACNTPVVSKSLENIPEEKRNKCGKASGDEKEMEEDIVEILNSPENFKNTRTVVEELYDYSVIQKNTRKVYDRLLSDASTPLSNRASTPRLRRASA